MIFKTHTELEMQEANLKLKSIFAPEMKIMRKELITIMRNFDSVGRGPPDR